MFVEIQEDLFNVDKIVSIQKECSPRISATTYDIAIYTITDNKQTYTYGTEEDRDAKMIQITNLLVAI